MRKAWMAGAVMAVWMVGAGAYAGDGPTPFPDAKDEAAWPGKGPIRVFGWMVDNRNWFWTQREKDQGAIVFVGDSLTGNWRENGFNAMFPGRRVANRGIGGDGSRGVLFRFDEDVMDLNPALVVINIGSNDLSAHANPADMESNLKATIEKARARKPDMPIVLCTIAPRAHPQAPMRPGALADINTRIRNLAAAENVTLLDLFPLLADADGEPVPENFQKDRLHLAKPGYEIWAKALNALFDAALPKS